MKIAFIKNSISQHSVVNYMERGLSEAINRSDLGIKCQLLAYANTGKLFQDLESGEFDCTMGINCSVDRGLFYDLLSLPHISISLDFLFWSSFSDIVAPGMVLCFSDQESVEHLNKKYQKKSFFFPHGCCLDYIPRSGTSQREIPFLFSGSDLDEENEINRWREIWGDTVAKKLLEEAESCLLNTREPFIEQAERVFNTIIQPISSEFDDLQKQMFFFRSFETVVRGRDRTKLLSCFSSQTVHIATDEASWVRFQRKHQNVHLVYEGAKSFEEILSLFLKTKVVLHTMPPSFRHAFHERALYALACGCSLYSGTMFSLPPWLQEKGIVSFYDQGASPPRTMQEKMRDSVLRWLQEEHSWDARVQAFFPSLMQEILRVKN